MSWFKNNKKRAILLQGILIILGVFFVALDKLYLINDTSICLYKRLFGVPCLACGGTRCFRNFYNLNFVEAFKYHPIVFLFMIFLIICDIAYLYDTFMRNR